MLKSKNLKIPLKLWSWWKSKKKEITKIRKRKKQRIRKSISPTNWGLIFWVPILTGIWRLITSRFLTNPENIIQQVIIDEESLIIYDSQEIQEWITQYFSGMNRSTYTYTKQGDFESTIKEQFPIIQDIQITKPKQKNTILAQIIFNSADLALTHDGSTWIASDNQAYKVQASDSIQEWLTRIRLPSRETWYESLEGIFYHIHSSTLVTVINNIFDIIDAKDIKDIEYFAGGQKLHLTYKDKLILFHLDKSIDSQLAKLLDLTQYYNDFNAVTRLDLWSNNDIIVK